MNGRKAKALRKQVYGDMSIRTPRQYEGKWGSGSWGTIRNKPGTLRQLYQQAKKAGK